MPSVKITFYYPYNDAIPDLENASPDMDWHLFGTGVNVWIAQTYIRLKLAGAPVSISPVPTDEGIVVLHADDMHKYLKSAGANKKCLIVCVRADREPQPYADFEIVQNMASSRNTRCRHVPHWPQPGLIPRDERRGAELSNVAFKGSNLESNAMFKSELWSDFLRSESLHWVEDQAYWTGGGAKGYKDVSWNDYSNIDLIVAIRRDPSNKYNNKPASKLINAWLAGVPAILGAEVAYRELRKSRLDYMEAVTLEDVIGSIRMLKSNPEVYKSMVDNGKIRAQEFGAKKIEARWLCLLMDDLTKIYHSPFWLMMRHLPIGARKRFRKILATDGALI